MSGQLPYLRETPQLQRAIKLYQDWHWRDPKAFFEMVLRWPHPQSVFAQALITGYWSDKFDEQQRTYTHAHKRPYPVILRQDDPQDTPWDRPFLPRYDESAFTELGYLLDIQVQYPGMGKPHYYDLKRGGRSTWPILAGDPDRNLLLGVERRTGDTILIWSPIMKITPRGIVN